jgi:Ca-activated chloride channel family protein
VTRSHPALSIAVVLTLAVAVLSGQQPPATGPAPAATSPTPAPQTATPPPSEPTTPAAQRPAAQAPSFRSGIDIVSLNVTVTDKAGKYVTDLTEAEFQVFETGIMQPLSFFNRRENPIAMSLLLDSSASMENKLATVQTAASNFVRRLKPTDVAQVIDFDNKVSVRQGFTSNHADLEKGILQMAPGGPTSLHNAIYIALTELKKIQVSADEDPRRQAIVLFSDGEDTSSLIPFEDVLDQAKRSETAIYAIGLRDKQNESRGFRNAEYVLRQLALDTGGKAYFPSSLGDLNGVYDQIAEELSNQYSLGYVSTNARRDGAWRPIVVQVTRPGLTTRTKRGYYAPTPQR